MIVTPRAFSQVSWWTSIYRTWIGPGDLDQMLNHPLSHWLSSAILVALGDVFISRISRGHVTKHVGEMFCEPFSLFCTPHIALRRMSHCYSGKSEFDLAFDVRVLLERRTVVRKYPFQWVVGILEFQLLAYRTICWCMILAEILAVY